MKFSDHGDNIEVYLDAAGKLDHFGYRLFHEVSGIFSLLIPRYGMFSAARHGGPTVVAVQSRRQRRSPPRRWRTGTCWKSAFHEVSESFHQYYHIFRAVRYDESTVDTVHGIHRLNPHASLITTTTESSDSVTTMWTSTRSSRAIHIQSIVGPSCQQLSSHNIHP